MALIQFRPFVHKIKTPIREITAVRHLFGFGPLQPPGSATANRKKYTERRILGWSQEQLYEIVSNVDEYTKFLPACNKSQVIERRDNFIKAKLEIGLPPLIVESYTSHVTLQRPTLVRAQCFEGKLFEHLETEWKFSEGIKNNPKTCVLDFRLDFQFRNSLYSKLTNAVFDEMVRQTVNAFMRRAREKYGKPEIIPPNVRI